jgi:hypothetical protein
MSGIIRLAPGEDPGFGYVGHHVQAIVGSAPLIARQGIPGTIASPGMLNPNYLYRTVMCGF